MSLITCSLVHNARLFRYSVCFIQTRDAQKSSSTYNIEQLKGKLYTNITTKVIFRWLWLVFISGSHFALKRKNKYKENGKIKSIGH